MFNLNKDIFTFPSDIVVPENWQINLFSKFQAAKETGNNFKPAINETALFIANNSSNIKQDELMTILNKIEKKFNVPVIDILKQAEAYKPTPDEEPEPEPEKQSNLLKAVNFIKLKFTTLHVNSFTGEIMYFKNNRLQPVNIESLLTLLEINNIKVNIRTLFSYFYSPDFTAHINPISEILKTFPEWEPGQPDFISEILNYLNFTPLNVSFDLKQHYYQMLLKSMIRTLENGLSDNKYFPNKQIIIFKGASNSRKTSFVRYFTSPFSNYVISDVNLNPKDVDTKKAIASNLFIFNDEFDKMTQNQLNNFKILTVLDFVKFKPAHRYTDKTFPRRSSFISTTDKKHFLTDLAGNVRFVIFDLANDFKNPIPEALLNNSELIKLAWAQAYYYYKQSDIGLFDSQLTSTEINNNNSINAQYFLYKDLRHAITTFYPPSYNCECTRLNASEFLQLLNNNTSFPKHLLAGISIISLGRLLKNYGYIQDNHTQGRIYKYKFENFN